MRSIATLLKTALFTVVVPGTVTVLVPRWLLAGDVARLPLGVFRWAGLPLLVAGTLVYLRCAWDFATAGRGTPAPIDPPEELVARGLYRHVRNPMYVGVLSVVLGEALVFASRALFVYAGAVFLVFHLFVVLYEEPTLTEEFGDSYRRFLREVPRWIPRWRRWRGL